MKRDESIDLRAHSRREVPFVVELCLEAAARLGWNTEVLDPAFGYLWEVELPGGRRRAMVGAKTPINDAAAAQLALDKHYAGVVLRRAGFGVPAGVRALSPKHFADTRYAKDVGLDPALELARAKGFPLIVKPNRLSHGRFVRLVETEKELRRGIEAIWGLDRVALAQTVVDGRELRVDVLDGELLAAYERRPFTVVGDGERDVATLLRSIDSRFESFDPKTLAKRLGETREARSSGGGTGLAQRVPAQGEKVTLDEPILNLNRLCTAELLPQLPDRWRDFAVRAGQALGLRLAGVDLRVRSLAADPSEATVIEVNATPLLAQLAHMGHRELAVSGQARILEALLRS
ncbi:hypothetical protein [Engelhardtia mirabilis]|uniref:ATP-grasp domain-containing protein n=1 Tax=Engelhardtia mirabilis TaxID=2528011 RepID=UPI0011A88F4B